jgi:hypothetical protein
MTGRRVGALLALAPGILCGVGCKSSHLRGDDAATTTENGAHASGGAGASGGARAPRCRALDAGVSLGLAGEVVLGEAAVSSRGVALGLVHQGTLDGAASVLSSVALLSPDAATSRVVDLCPTPADAPSPRVAWMAGSPEVVALSRSASTGLVVHRLGVEPPGARLLFSVPDARDATGAGDLATSRDVGVIVWESAPSQAPPRGVVRLAAFRGEAPPGPVRDLSGPESDAEGPRVVASDAGFVAVWAAGPTHTRAATGADASNAEVASESNRQAWLEANVLDPEGAPRGPSRRVLTGTWSLTGFDVAPDPGGGALVVARVESLEGGAVVRVRIRADGTAEAPVTLATDVGIGPPSFVEGDSRWAAWWGPGDRLMLAALRKTGAASPEFEDAFGDSVPLLSLADGRILSARAAGYTSSGELESFACTE